MRVAPPLWMDEVVDWRAAYPAGEPRMRLAVELARQNVLRRDGGPFGAVVFEADSGRVVAAGVNSVLRSVNSVLHAEIMAIMLAHRRLRSFTLAAPELPRHELVTSCDPCAMCFGATLWSGVKRLVCGATREDAVALNFDEGPVYRESYDYLRARGVAVERGILRGEAAAVLELYRREGGPIYNP